MKNYLLLLITFLFIGCAPTGTVITFDDEKSNAIRAHYQNYEANNVEGLQALWSSELELYANSTEAIGVAEISDFVNAHHENFSDIKLTWGEEDDGIDVWVETASYDNGFTVTQTWFNWVATGKNSGDSYNVPFHITFVWDENGKIAQEYHFGVDQLEKEVWNYESELDTHTVETHIYRLRKKIKDIFNDNNFIVSSKDGYKIN